MRRIGGDHYSDNKKDVNDFAMMQFIVLGFMGVCLFGFVLSEIVNRKKCIVTDEEIIKYKGKQIVFKIDKRSIIEMVYKKPTVAMRSLFLFGVFVRIPLVGILSICYKNAETDGSRAAHSYDTLDTLDEEDKRSGTIEHLELLSNREIRKISRLLQVEVNYI